LTNLLELEFHVCMQFQKTSSIYHDDYIYRDYKPGGETYRVVTTSVPTFFVRMLGKLLDACITDWMTPDDDSL
jgi:hypothetical protein